MWGLSFYSQFTRMETLVFWLSAINKHGISIDHYSIEGPYCFLVRGFWVESPNRDGQDRSRRFIGTDYHGFLTIPPEDLEIPLQQQRRFRTGEDITLQEGLIFRRQTLMVALCSVDLSRIMKDVPRLVEPEPPVYTPEEVSAEWLNLKAQNRSISGLSRFEDKRFPFLPEFVQQNSWWFDLWDVNR